MFSLLGLGHLDVLHEVRVNGHHLVGEGALHLRLGVHVLTKQLGLATAQQRH